MIWQGFENTLFTLEVFPPVREGSHPGNRREGQGNQGPHVGSTDVGGGAVGQLASAFPAEMRQFPTLYLHPC